MRCLYPVAIGALLGISALAQAQTKVMEGRGTAKNAAGLNAPFAFRVGQQGTNAPTGRVEIGWTREGTQVSIVCEHPRFLGILEHQGRTHGPGRVTVKRGSDVHSWEGTVYFSAWDLRPPGGGTRRDRIRVRFIKDPWGTPEGDFFFEGEVMEGDVVVRQS